MGYDINKELENTLNKKYKKKLPKGYKLKIIQDEKGNLTVLLEPKKKIVKRENLKTKPVTEFPILETLTSVETRKNRNSGYVKADVTKDGEVIFSSTNNAKEACTAKEINKLLK